MLNFAINKFSLGADVLSRIQKKFKCAYMDNLDTNCSVKENYSKVPV